MAKRQRRRRQERRQEHAKRQGWTTRHSLVTGVAVTAGGILGVAQPALGATYTVNNNGDAGNNVCEDAVAGDCTLRDAVYSANNNSGSDNITFQSSITGITLTGEIDIYDGVNIFGNGANATTISGNNNDRIFFINTFNSAYAGVNIYDVTLTQGNVGTADGGAFF